MKSIGIVATLLAISGAMVIDFSGQSPVSAYGLVAVGSCLAYWRTGGILRAHHWVAAGVVAVISVLPWGRVQGGPTAGVPTTLLGLAIAAMIIVAGFCDHARLVRLVAINGGSFAGDEASV